MPEPWELTKEEAAAEGSRLEERRSAADRDDAGFLQAQMIEVQHAEHEHHCPNISRRKRLNLGVRIGFWLYKGRAYADVCPRCGDYTLPQEELNALERRASIVVLKCAEQSYGPAYTFARKALGLTREALAEMAGVTADDLHLLEECWKSENDTEARVKPLLLRALRNKSFAV